MSNNQLKIHGIAIRRTTLGTEAVAGAPVQLVLAIDVENLSDQPLNAWASCKDYSYDPSTHVLTVDFAEPIRQVPPHIIMISDHPRIPAQVVVNPKSRATIKVQIPAKVNRPGSEDGPRWVEDPIGQIDRVDIRLQYGAEPIQYRRGEQAPDFRKRLQEHGDVVRAEIIPTTETEK